MGAGLWPLRFRGKADDLRLGLLRNLQTEKWFPGGDVAGIAGAEGLHLLRAEDLGVLGGDGRLQLFEHRLVHRVEEVGQLEFLTLGRRAHRDDAHRPAQVRAGLREIEIPTGPAPRTTTKLRIRQRQRRALIPAWGNAPGNESEMSQGLKARPMLSRTHGHARPAVRFHPSR